MLGSYIVGLGALASYNISYGIKATTSRDGDPDLALHRLLLMAVYSQFQENGLRNFDFSSWESVLTTLVGIALFALVGIGVRLVMMTTIQQRQQRQNRQINERLKTLIAAYKVLGGSFTGRLSVDPRHLRDIRAAERLAAEQGGETVVPRTMSDEMFERVRQMRDAVEAAMSDVILLGTDEHVRLAEKAARDLVAGNQIHTDDLVVSLRNFIRKSLDLSAIPTELQIPMQGPTRPASAGGRGKGGGQQTTGGREGGAGGGGNGGGMGMGTAGQTDEAIHPASQA